MRNQNFGQMQQMMQMQNAMRQQQMQQAPASSAVSMPPMQNVVAQQPQFTQGYQGMNPIAMAQMLRGRTGSSMPFVGMTPTQRQPMMGVSGMGDAMGMGVNPNAGNIYGGINPLTNRNSYLNFINSMSGG